MQVSKDRHILTQSSSLSLHIDFSFQFQPLPSNSTSFLIKSPHLVPDFFLRGFCSAAVFISLFQPLCKRISSVAVVYLLRQLYLYIGIKSLGLRCLSFRTLHYLRPRLVRRFSARFVFLISIKCFLSSNFLSGHVFALHGITGLIKVT